MQRLRFCGTACLMLLVAALLPTVPEVHGQPITVDLAFGTGTNPGGQQIQYIYIPGTSPVASGGVCQYAVDDTYHNWNGITFCATSAGSLTVTLNSDSLTPYSGGSCGWSTDMQGLLYQGALEDINPASACTNLLQDFYVNNSGGGALAPGQSFTFDIPAAGTYTFVSTPGCDSAGIGVVTGTANYTLSGPITAGPCAPVAAIPTLSHWGMIVFALIVVAIVFAVFRLA